MAFQIRLRPRRILNTKLNDPELSKKCIVYYSSLDPQKRSNSVTVIGVYAVYYLRFTPDEACKLVSSMYGPRCSTRPEHRHPTCTRITQPPRARSARCEYGGTAERTHAPLRLSVRDCTGVRRAALRETGGLLSVQIPAAPAVPRRILRRLHVWAYGRRCHPRNVRRPALVASRWVGA